MESLEFEDLDAWFPDGDAENSDDEGNEQQSVAGSVALSRSTLYFASDPYIT